MGDFDSDLRERLRRLVSSEEPSQGSWDGIECKLRLSDGVASAGSRTRALAAVAVTLVVAASVLVMRQVSDGDQRVVVGNAAPDTTAGSATGSASPESPGTTTVMTANATATAGLATATLQLLQSAGYVGTRSEDALRPSDTSRVYFAPGYEAEARAVARLLGLSESAVDPAEAPVAQPTGSDLVVVVGQDLIGLRATGPPTTRGDLPSPPLTRGPAPPTSPSIATGRASDGRAWSLSIGGPSNVLCFGVELVPGGAARASSCAGSPWGLPPTDLYRPLFHNELRTPPFVFGRMPAGTVAVEVVSSSPVGGRVSVIEGAGGPYVVVELPDRTKPEAVIGYRADGTSERYAVPG